MKKIMLAVLVVGVIAGLVFLSKAGLIPGWQALTMIFAAVAAPFKLLMNIFGNTEADIRKTHEKIRQRESGYQEELESKIQERQSRIDKLNQDINTLDSKIESLRLRRENIDLQVEQMGLEELQSEGRRLFR